MKTFAKFETIAKVVKLVQKECTERERMQGAPRFKFAIYEDGALRWGWYYNLDEAVSRYRSLFNEAEIHH